MRTFMMSTVVGLMVMAMAATSSAGEPAPSAPVARPKIDLALSPVTITDFRRPTGWLPAYTGGSVPIVIDLYNSSQSAANDVVVRLDIGEKVIEKTVSIGARRKLELAFEDTEGLPSACKAKPYTIKLAVPGAAEITRSAHVQPHCTFTSTIEETWNLKSPDRVEAEKTGNAYLSRPGLVSAPTCSAGPTLKVRMVNRSAYGSPSVIVQAKDWDATPQARSQTSAAFAIASGEDKELLLTPIANAAGEVPERMNLTIVDWTKSLKGRTSDGGIFVNTKRSCQLVYDLH